MNELDITFALRFEMGPSFLTPLTLNTLEDGEWLKEKCLMSFMCLTIAFYKSSKPFFQKLEWHEN